MKDPSAGLKSAIVDRRCAFDDPSEKRHQKHMRSPVYARYAAHGSTDSGALVPQWFAGHLR